MRFFTLCLWWKQSFRGLTEHQVGGCEADDFRALIRLTAAQEESYFLRPHLFYLSDRMELAAGRLSAPGIPWGWAGELQTDRRNQLCQRVSG